MEFLWKYHIAPPHVYCANGMKVKHKKERTKILEITEVTMSKNIFLLLLFLLRTTANSLNWNKGIMSLTEKKKKKKYYTKNYFIF